MFVKNEIAQLKEELERLKKEAQNREDRYRSIFKGLNSSIAVIEALEDGKDFVFKDINSAFERLENIKKNEVIGKRLTEVFPGSRHLELFRILKRVWKTGKRQTFSTTIYKAGRIAGSREHQVFKLPNGELVVVHEDVGPLIEEIRREKRREEQIRAIFQAADRIAFIITDLSEKTAGIKEFSPGARGIFGYTEKEIKGLSFSILCPREDRDKFHEFLSQLLLGQKITEECTLIRKSGDPFPAYLSAYPIHDEDHQLTGALWVAVDITNLRMAEVALKASEERFRASFEYAMVAMALLDTEGGFLRVNRALCSMLGYSRDELLEMSYQDVTHPNDIDKTKEYFQAVLSGRVDYIQFEKRCVHKDGRVLWGLINCTMVRDLYGEPGYFVVQIVDITERKQAEQALMESYGRFNTVMDSLDACVFVADISTYEILFVNKKMKELFGDCVGKKCWQAMNNLTNGPCNYCNNEALVDKEGKPSGIHVWEYQNPINNHWYEVRDRAIRWVDGRIVRLSIATDISERKQMEKERERLQQRIHQAQRLESLGVLAGGIAHDFNNLLMGILGNADLALMKLPPESPARSCIQMIETAALRASELTNQMLAYSGKGSFLVEPLNLSKIVEEMAHLLETVISKKAVLKFNFAPNLPLIEGDAAQIRQVIMNLITNASDAIGDKSGVITVTTGVMEADRSYLADTYLDDELPEGYFVYVEVSDTGCGMDDETRSKIFDPFFSTKFTGRGLGLAAVLGIVRGHGGAIKVYSEKGRGTTFKVLFPCCERPCVETQGPRNFSGFMVQGQKVLVVDDEETVRTVAKMMLEEMGFQVLSAPDGKKAIEIYRQDWKQIDLVLLDMTMPKLNGEETFRELRRINPDVKVILSSGYNEQDATDRFAGKGLSGFIQKPYRSQDLAESISKVLFSDSG